DEETAVAEAQRCLQCKNEPCRQGCPVEVFIPDFIKLVGSGSRLACFSFNGNKIITTGGGGMIVTDDEALADRARYLATQAKDDTVEYVHNEVGYNYRLTNIQAALGCAQMEQLDEFIAAKKRLARTYEEALAGTPGLMTLQEAGWAESIFWLCTILIDEADYGLDARTLRERLHRAGIQSRTLWQPLHLSPAHQGAQSPGGCPVAETAHQKALTLPSSVGLSPEDQDRVIEMVKG
ncbi:MAG: DegT/DnrJ/EryC1/StrS family aminotransferase, partial [Deltaproteobacteria bacterium]|nr:DegT/DnrJ/EryC1/StrS family aminotransferase [Deltaproteobacteria bacterium]